MAYQLPAAIATGASGPGIAGTALKMGEGALVFELIQSILGGAARGVGGIPGASLGGANVPPAGGAPTGGKFFISEQVPSDYMKWYQKEMYNQMLLRSIGINLDPPMSPADYISRMEESRILQGENLTRRQIELERTKLAPQFLSSVINTVLSQSNPYTSNVLGDIGRAQ